MKSISWAERLDWTMNRNGHLSDILIDQFQQSLQMNILFWKGSSCSFLMNVKSWNDSADSPNCDGSCLMRQLHIIWSEAEGRLMTAAHFNQVLRVHFCHVGAAGGIIKTALSTDDDLSQSIYSRFAPLFLHHPILLPLGTTIYISISSLWASATYSTAKLCSVYYTAILLILIVRLISNIA